MHISEHISKSNKSDYFFSKDPLLKSFYHTFLEELQQRLKDFLIFKGEIFGGATKNITKVKQVSKDIVPFLPTIAKSFAGQAFSTMEQRDAVKLAKEVSIFTEEEITKSAKNFSMIITQSFKEIIEKIESTEFTEILAKKMVKRLFSTFEKNEPLLKSMSYLISEKRKQYWHDKSSGAQENFYTKKLQIFNAHCVYALIWGQSSKKTTIKMNDGRFFSVHGICRKIGVKKNDEIYVLRGKGKTKLNKYGTRDFINDYDVIYDENDWIVHNNLIPTNNISHVDLLGIKARREAVKNFNKELTNIVKTHEKSHSELIKVCDKNEHTFKSSMKNTPCLKILMIARSNIKDKIDELSTKKTHAYKKLLVKQLKRCEDLIAEEFFYDMEYLIENKEYSPSLQEDIKTNYKYLKANNFTLKKKHIESRESILAKIKEAKKSSYLKSSPSQKVLSTITKQQKQKKSTQYPYVSISGQYNIPSNPVKHEKKEQPEEICYDSVEESQGNSLS